MKHNFRYLPLLILFLFSCKKADPHPDVLPPATQEGKNTFGCFLNGKVWVPYTYALFARKITPVFGSWVSIEALHYEDPKASDKQTIVISFLPDRTNPVRTYHMSLDDDAEAFAAYYDRQGCYYYSDPEDIMEGHITITKYDLLEEKVIAGTFKFTLGKEDCETLHFADGRFDIRVP